MHGYPTACTYAHGAYLTRIGSVNIYPNARFALTPTWMNNIRDLAYGIAHVSPKRIDEINILNASIEAMQLAIDAMARVPETILVDGNKFKPYQDIPHHCIIGGDGKYRNIAASNYRVIKRI